MRVWSSLFFFSCARLAVAHAATSATARIARTARIATPCGFDARCTRSVSGMVVRYFQSSSTSSSSSSRYPSSSSSSSSSSSADSNSKGSVPATFNVAPHSSQLMVSPSSTSSSSTSILPSQTGHSTMKILPNHYCYTINGALCNSNFATPDPDLIVPACGWPSAETYNEN